MFLTLCIRWLGVVFNLRGLASLHRLPVYFLQWRRFARGSTLRAPLVDGFPCLDDATLRTGFDAHYFFQAAWLARKVAVGGHPAHTDIGSDVRMIGVLSAQVPVEFVDIRLLPVELPGLVCTAGDLTGLARPDRSIASLSCLHVIEHVGLARYGDRLDGNGHEQAIRELVRVLARDGDLYVSVPVGRERVCFNAHRVFAPRAFPALFAPLALVGFAYVDDAGRFHPDADPAAAENCEYGCGMFHFRRQT